MLCQRRSLFLLQLKRLAHRRDINFALAIGTIEAEVNGDLAVILHLGCICFSVKYFRERKIFYSVWLHFKNYIRKPFSLFGNILKILFS